jgi:type VI secretion system protein ImpG
MRDELLHYYERELDFIRRAASEFAEAHPAVAGRLLLEESKCDDPHVERLIESFAMLAARVQMRLTDDFTEVTDALLGVLYPHYLSPIPSMTLVQLVADPDSIPPEGMTVERHATLYSRAHRHVRCRFRTAYPVTLWPVEVESVEVLTATQLGAELPPGVRAALRIRLRAKGGASFAELSIDRLRLFIDGGSGIVQQLFETLLRAPQGVAVQRAPATPAELLPADCIRPVGFGREEGLLEYPQESFLGYRVIQEYFAFPEKFMFVDLLGLDRLSIDVEGESLDVSILLSESAAELDLRPGPENLKLGCTPAVNLFEHHADPIRLTHASIEYPVVPDPRARDAYEVYSIQDVSSHAMGGSEVHRYEPIYRLRHGAAVVDAAGFWHAARRPSIRRGDAGTEVFLSLVDEKFNPLLPPTEVVEVRTLCTNRDLPARLSFGDPGGDFDLEGRPGISRVRCLRNPTPPVRSPTGEGSRWRIVSHLALNYLSLSDATDGEGSSGSGRALDALSEILKLYDFADSPTTRQRIAGLVGLRSRRIVRRVGSGELSGFARGTLVELEFDPEQYAGTSVFLFASVLEAFLGLYGSVNAFTQVAARIRNREGVLKRWPPRAGEIYLL